MLGMSSARAGGGGGWSGGPDFFLEGYSASCIVVNCVASVGDRPYGVLREPCRLPLDFKGDVKYGRVFVVRVYAGKLFRCEAIVYMLAEVLCNDIVRLPLYYVV